MNQKSNVEVLDYGKVIDVEPSGFEPRILTTKGAIVVAGSFSYRGRDQNPKSVAIGKKLFTARQCEVLKQAIFAKRCFALCLEDRFLICESDDRDSWYIEVIHTTGPSAELLAEPNFYSQVP